MTKVASVFARGAVFSVSLWWEQSMSWAEPPPQRHGEHGGCTETAWELILVAALLRCVSVVSY